MIVRAWRGWTTPDNANAYQDFLRDVMFPMIYAKGIKGFHGISLLRMDGAEEVEFMTLMRFDSLEAVKGFAGEQYDVAVVLPRAREVLKRFDARSSHYEVSIPEETI